MKKIVQRIVVAVVIVHKGKILIIQRSANEDTFPNLWEIPSGRGNLLKSLKTPLSAKFFKETGIKVRPIAPIDVFEFKVERDSEIRNAT